MRKKIIVGIIHSGELKPKYSIEKMTDYLINFILHD